MKLDRDKLRKQIISDPDLPCEIAPPVAASEEPEATEALIEFVTKAHRGQVYKHPDGDQPYIFHVLRVAAVVSPKSVPAALLHDYLEDCSTPLPGGINEHTMLAVELLTRGDETYESYINDIIHADGPAGNIAFEVKVADLKDNLKNIRPGHRESLRPRYEKALAALAPTEPVESEPVAFKCGICGGADVMCARCQAEPKGALNDLLCIAKVLDQEGISEPNKLAKITVILESGTQLPCTEPEGAREIAREALDAQEPSTTLTGKLHT